MIESEKFDKEVTVRPINLDNSLTSPSKGETIEHDMNDEVEEDNMLIVEGQSHG